MAGGISPLPRQSPEKLYHQEELKLRLLLSSPQHVIQHITHAQRLAALSHTIQHAKPKLMEHGSSFRVKEQPTNGGHVRAQNPVPVIAKPIDTNMLY